MTDGWYSSRSPLHNELGSPASAAPPFVTLHTRQVNLCLGVAAGNAANGTAIISYTGNGHIDQQWEHINPDGFLATHLGAT